MKSTHRHWLKKYMENLELSNRSFHTIVNYHHDIVKYIDWYEREHKDLINCAGPNTISQYIQFLTKEPAYLQNNHAPMGKYKTVDEYFFYLLNFVFYFERFFFRGDVLESPIENEKRKVDDEHQGHALLQTLPKTPHTLLSVASRRRHLSSLKNFYEFLKQSYEDAPIPFKTNPVKSKIHNIKLKDQDVNPTKRLTPDDWRKILDTKMTPKEKFIVNVLYFGGLRLSELATLKSDGMDKSTKTIKIARKGGAIHYLPIQNFPKIHSMLQDWLALRSHKIGPYVFSTPRGGHTTPRTLYNVIGRILKRAECPTKGLTPHSFRKACASNLYKKTKDLLLVRDYLNHSDAKVTQTYIERY